MEKTAKEMFEELGYVEEKVFNSNCLSFINKEKDTIVTFTISKKTYDVVDKEANGMLIDMELHPVITKKLEELG
jgi:hypothetical protein